MPRDTPGSPSNGPDRGESGRRRWVRKFGHAFRGTRRGLRDQDSFYVHFAVALAVVVAATLLGATRTEWCLLVVSITVVLGAEMFNTALEHLARAITDEHHPRIEDALDIGSGAVLVAAVGASIVGVIVLGTRLADWFGLWSA